jgi:sigma-E factor negative regulatory protein RseC
MITEEGIVTQIKDRERAWVKAEKNSTCKGCTAHGFCEAAKQGEVEAVNILGAEVGDTVVLGFESASLIKVSLLLYIFPVAAMIIGAVIGVFLADDFGVSESDLSAVFAFLSLAISFLCIRLVSNNLSQTGKYQAKIIKIKKRLVPVNDIKAN